MKRNNKNINKNKLLNKYKKKTKSNAMNCCKKMYQH